MFIAPHIQAKTNDPWRDNERYFHFLSSARKHSQALNVANNMITQANTLTLAKNTLQEAFSYRYAAQACFALKKYQEAIANYKKAAVLFDKALNNNPHVYTAQTITALGRVYQQQKDYSKAKEAYTLAISIYDNALTKTNTASTEVKFFLVETFLSLGDIISCEDILLNLKELHEKIGFHDDNLLKIYNYLSQIYTSSKQLYTAEIYKQKATELFQSKKIA